MNNVWYKLVFKQIDPLHIGKFNYGVLSETRIFIPGWTMWGAMVNKYGKYKGGKDEDFGEYKKIFETITCFYPSFDQKGEEILFPQYNDGEFFLGCYSEEKFRLEFTDVYVSTAVNPCTCTAKDESLHEIEIVLPKSNNNDSSKQIYWGGLLGIEKNVNDIDDLVNEWLEITVGGDSRYGFGRLELIGKQKVQAKDLEEWGMDLEGRPVTNGPLRNYMEYCDNALEMGKIEHVVIEANFFKATPTLEETKICAVPGSKGGKCGILKRGIFIGN